MYKMVIIDDEKWAARSLLAIVRSQIWFQEAGEASDALSGLQLLEKTRPQLAFVDVEMPGMSGLELLQSAQNMGLSTLFIMISGHAEFAYAQKAMFHGAISYCLKPFSKNELLDSMEKAYHMLERAVGDLAGVPYASPPAPQPVKHTVRGDEGAASCTANRMVNEMLQYIHAHFQENISVQDLAALCFINQSYAGQLFRQEMGDTFNNYLAHIRVEKAIGLLTQTDMNIAAIAVAVGYRDYFYFAKVFKRVTGMTPSGYRNST